MKLSIIVPVYNEKSTIRNIISIIHSVSLPEKIDEREIVIVDDFSNDGTREVYPSLEQENIKVYHHEKNYGKGRALRTGFEKATGDIIMLSMSSKDNRWDDFPIVEDYLAQVKFSVATVIQKNPNRLHFYLVRSDSPLSTRISQKLRDLDVTYVAY